jgi:uncharacterized protein involved in exopolysaccharide biosynthesis
MTSHDQNIREPRGGTPGSTTWHSAADDEISFRELISVYARYWRRLAALSVAFVLLGVGIYAFFPVFEAKGLLFFDDHASNSLQTVSNALVNAGLGGGAKVDQPDSVAKSLIVLRSRSFHVDFLKRLRAIDLRKLSPADRQALVSLDKSYLDGCLFSPCVSPSEDQMAMRLMKLSRLNEGDANSVELSFRSSSAELSTLLTNEFMKLAVSRLVGSDYDELEKAQSFLESELASSEGRQRELNTSVVGYRTRYKILSVDPQQDSFNAMLSQLREKIEETELQLAENKKLAESLREQSAAQGNSEGKFGALSGLKQLENENLVLSARADALNKSLSSYMKKSSSLPQEQQRLLNLSKQSEVEFAIYEELRRQLIKLNLQRLSAAEKVKILEPASVDAARHKPDLLTLLVLALMMAQLAGSGMVFVSEYLSPSRKRSSPGGAARNDNQSREAA